MNFLERFQWLFLILAIFLGLSLGQVGGIAETAAHLVVPFLMVMLFGVFLQTPLESLKKGFMDTKVVGLSLAINFLWTPLLALTLSFFFFRDVPDVFVALIMDLVTPCTDWYLVFTAIVGGNLALSTALLPWNLFLQLILMPVYLFLFAGAMVEIQPGLFLESFIRVLLAPFIIAFVTRKAILFYKGEKWFREKIIGIIPPFQSLCLILAIIAMFTSQGLILLDNLNLVVRLIIPLILFFTVNFALGQIVGRLFKLNYREGASLIITILARNAPLALTIAVATFPERPLIPLVLAVESLIELPILFVFSQLMLFIYKRKWWPNLN